MRRYRVTAVTAAVTMGLMLVLFGLAGSVLADQNKDTGASQSQPAAQLQEQAPEVEGCGHWYLLQHRDELFPTTGVHTNWHTAAKEGFCGYGGTACFYSPDTICIWEFGAVEGALHSKCR